MKFTLKKLLVTSLSAVCLLAHGQTHAMEKESSLSSSTALTSSILGQSGFGQSSLLNPSISDLIQHFGKEKAEEMIRGSLSQSSLSLSTTQRVISPEEMAYNSTKSKELDLFPPLKFAEISLLVDEYLLPKYTTLLQEDYSVDQISTEFGMNQTESNTLLKIILENKSAIEQLSEAPYPLNLVVNMLSPFSFPTIAIQQGFQFYGNIDNNQNLSLLRQCVGMKRGQLFVRLDFFMNELSMNVNLVYNQMGGDINQRRQKLLKVVKGTLSKALGIPNKFEIDIETQAPLINKTVQNWFNTIHLLAKFELDRWKDNKKDLDALIDHYVFIEQQLTSAAQGTAYFSGVVKLPGGFGLVEVSEKQKDTAEDVGFLRTKVDEYKKPLEAKLNAYNKAKPYLSSLEKLVNWIDDVFAEVSKNGRIS